MRYTLRHIPASVLETIRRRAKKEKRTLNSVALEALIRGVALSPEYPKNYDLDFMIGTWVEDPEFDAIVNDMRRIDSEMWE